MRGDSFVPPAFCHTCRFELFEQVPHVCDVPIEGTAAWYDPAYEQRWMATRHKRNNVGDVTQQKRTPLDSRYTQSILGHRVSDREREMIQSATFAATFGPPPEGFIRTPTRQPTKVTVEIRKTEPIALGPGYKVMGELTARTLPTYEEFDQMLTEWHAGLHSELVSVVQHMGITWEEYALFVEMRR